MFPRKASLGQDNVLVLLPYTVLHRWAAQVISQSRPLCMLIITKKGLSHRTDPVYI